MRESGARYRIVVLKVYLSTLKNKDTSIIDIEEELALTNIFGK
jgi:hypothetical protein